jgi:hypothetical protein
VDVVENNIYEVQKGESVWGWYTHFKSEAGSNTKGQQPAEILSGFFTSTANRIKEMNTFKKTRAVLAGSGY